MLKNEFLLKLQGRIINVKLDFPVSRGYTGTGLEFMPAKSQILYSKEHPSALKIVRCDLLISLRFHLIFSIF